MPLNELPYTRCGVLFEELVLMAEAVETVNYSACGAVVTMAATLHVRQMAIRSCEEDTL